MGYEYNEYNSGRGGFLSSIPPVTKNIVAINILVFIATLINENFMVVNFAMFYPASPFFKPWQILTHMFMHGGFWHIFFNMYTLLMFGIILERALGSKKFLIFYFVTGLGAAALHTGVEWIQAQYFLSAGAAVNYHNLLFPPVTLTAKWFVLIFAGIELFTGISGFQDGVAHFAHLGGMLFGWLLIRWWRKKGEFYY